MLTEIGVAAGEWMPEEDAALMAIVAAEGPGDWTTKSVTLGAACGFRSSTAVRKRYNRLAGIEGPVRSTGESQGAKRKAPPEFDQTWATSSFDSFSPNGVCKGCIPRSKAKHSCGKQYPQATAARRYGTMCEGCGVKYASCGTATERKRRWCDRCGKAHVAINVNVSGTKRPRLDPPNSLLEGAAGAQVARARERMASGDATSLLLAMVKQELPVDATCQTYTLGNTCKSAAPPHPHQQPVQGLQENLRDPGTLGIVSRESWRDLSSVGLVSELRVEHVAPGLFAESNSVRAGMSLESTLHYALAGNLSETVPVVAQRIGMPVQTFRFAELSNLIRSQRPLSESL